MDERKFKLCRTQRKKIFIFQQCHILFWGLVVLHPNLGKHVQQLKNSWFLEVLNVIFGFLVQKTLPVPFFFKILASLEVILCTKNIIFCHDFTVFHDIHEILKIQYFGIYQQLGKVWRKSDRYEWHFQFFLDNVIWNYPYINQFKNLDKIKCLKIQTGINY